MARIILSFRSVWLLVIFRILLSFAILFAWDAILRQRIGFLLFALLLLIRLRLDVLLRTVGYLNTSGRLRILRCSPHKGSIRIYPAYVVMNGENYDEQFITDSRG